MNDEYKSIKRLIWLYLFLLLFEGALRKWGPGALNYPLLVIRAPVALAIYVLCFVKNAFPINGYVILLAGMSVVTFVSAIIMGHGDIRVAAYGVNYNFFHFPLMWVMGRVLDREDVKKMGLVLMLLAIPNTLLMVAQFNASPLDPINKGVGEELGGQLDGGMGKIRPPGIFTFITGNAMFYPLAAAFAFMQFTEKRTVWWWLLLPILVCVALAQYISISRSMMLATAIVAFAAVVSLIRKGVLSPKILLLAVLAPLVGWILVNFVPVFDDAKFVFEDRWERSTDARGGVESAIIERFTGGLTNAFVYARLTGLFGEGIGMGSNVGSRFLTGRITFLLAEEEWSRVVMEMGAVFGFLYIGMRVAIFFAMFSAAAKRFFGQKDTMPAILFSAAALPVLQGQLAPPTMLGFTVIGGGLVLAACNDPNDGDEDDAEEDDEDDIEDEDEEIDLQEADDLLGPRFTERSSNLMDDYDPRQ